PTRQDSQCAHESAPCLYHPPCLSNSRRSVSKRCVAASICAACSAIRSPSSSSSLMHDWISCWSDIDPHIRASDRGRSHGLAQHALSSGLSRRSTMSIEPTSRSLLSEKLEHALHE